MSVRHVETACDRCLICHDAVAEGEAEYEDTLLVSLMLADDAVFDCTLVMHRECNALRIESAMGVELLTVTALGRAMVRAAEAGLTRKRESQSQAAGGQSPKTQRERRPH